MVNDRSDCEEEERGEVGAGYRSLSGGGGEGRMQMASLILGTGGCGGLGGVGGEERAVTALPFCARAVDLPLAPNVRPTAHAHFPLVPVTCIC